MDMTAFANEHRDGLNRTLGLTFTDVSPGSVSAVVPVGPHLHQPYGIVHGGVYASIAETLCSVGAAISVLPKNAVGLDNHTSFLRALRDGVIHGRAVPIHQGRRTQVWECELRDSDQRLLATSRVRLMVLDGEASLAGETVTLVDQAMRESIQSESD